MVSVPPPGSFQERDFESPAGARSGSSPDPELVSRGVQRTLGLLTGTVVLGLALGGLFGLAYAYAYGSTAAPA